MREYASTTTASDISLLDILADENTPPERYKNALHGLGRSLGVSLLQAFGCTQPASICLACTVEDADSLTQGIIDQLTEQGLGGRVKLVCFWNDRIELPERSLAPIIKEYREPCDLENSVLIVVKSIIASACVVRTNLANLVARARPQRIFVVAPVMFKGADESLAVEFSPEVSSLFEYITFAIDDERNGKWVVPGVGGDIYKRLGYEGLEQKNRYIPQLVKHRRSQDRVAA